MAVDSTDITPPSAVWDARRSVMLAFVTFVLLLAGTRYSASTSALLGTAGATGLAEDGVPGTVVRIQSSLTPLNVESRTWAMTMSRRDCVVEALATVSTRSESLWQT